LMHFSVRSGDTPDPIDYRTGEYEIVATYEFFDLSARSDPVNFTVRQPPAEEMPACRAFVSEHTRLRTVLFPASDDWPTGTRETYQEVVTKWPQSAYAKHALYYSAWIDQHLKDCEKAVKEYQRLLCDYDRFAYSEMAEIHIVECEPADPGERLDLLLSLPERHRRNAHLHGLLKHQRLRVKGPKLGRFQGVDDAGSPPVVLCHAEPVYPDSARRAGIEGL
jgi:hypothetical protein